MHSPHNALGRVSVGAARIRDAGCVGAFPTMLSVGAARIRDAGCVGALPTMLSVGAARIRDAGCVPLGDGYYKIMLILLSLVVKYF